MKENKIKLHLNNMHLHTQLLEANDWDEDATNKVMEVAARYFAESDQQDLMHVYANLVNLVGETNAEIFYNYLKGFLNGEFSNDWY